MDRNQKKNSYKNTQNTRRRSKKEKRYFNWAIIATILAILMACVCVVMGLVYLNTRKSNDTPLETTASGDKNTSETIASDISSADTDPAVSSEETRDTSESPDVIEIIEDTGSTDATGAADAADASESPDVIEIPDATETPSPTPEPSTAEESVKNCFDRLTDVKDVNLYTVEGADYVILKQLYRVLEVSNNEGSDQIGSGFRNFEVLAYILMEHNPDGLDTVSQDADRYAWGISELRKSFADTDIDDCKEAARKFVLLYLGKFEIIQNEDGQEILKNHDEYDQDDSSCLEAGIKCANEIAKATIISSLSEAELTAPNPDFARNSEDAMYDQANLEKVLRQMFAKDNSSAASEQMNNEGTSSDAAEQMNGDGMSGAASGRMNSEGMSGAESGQTNNVGIPS